MEIEEIKIKNFKSLYDLSFSPGKINVFIGANGSGKSSLLEAIGVLSAAMTDRVNNNSLQRKGVRLSTSSLYKSQFTSIERSLLTVDLAMSREQNHNRYEYSVHLTTPTDNDSWKYHSESVCKNGTIVFGRSNRSSVQLNNKVGYYSLSEKLTGEEYTSMGNYISGYGIYQPDTLTLRGNVADPTQITPIGLNGGRLADAPGMFAIDSFDHALNPRLAKRITEIFCRLIIESGKTVFMTTHNPLVLDGLNLADDRIRLFAMDRNKYGHAKLNRIQISPELLETGQSLSRLWINGRLGGVPDLL